MTETEWETNTTRPRLMLKRAMRHATGRQLQLLSCSICRLVWDMIPAPECQAAVAAAERMVDGILPPQEFQSFRFSATQHRQQILNRLEHLHSQFHPVTPNDLHRLTSELQRLRMENAAAALVMACLAENLKKGIQQQILILESMARESREIATVKPSRVPRMSELYAQMCDRIREIIYNPERERERFEHQPVSTAAWVIAEGCFHDQAFERLPILADVLEESGYADSEVLEHLRSNRQHVRGCWALDAVLRNR